MGWDVHMMVADMVDGTAMDLIEVPRDEIPISFGLAGSHFSHSSCARWRETGLLSAHIRIAAVIGDLDEVFAFLSCFGHTF